MRDIAKEAETVIKSLIKTKWVTDKRTGQKKEVHYLELKTNQLRKFLTAANSITNQINRYRIQHPEANELPDQLAAEIQFLKVKAAYQVGRNNTAREFMAKSQMITYIDGIGTSLEKYETFARYLEALVAYHKFYSEGDK